MKNQTLIKSNKISTSNYNHPVFYNEMSITPSNYLYMQIKNGISSGRVNREKNSKNNNLSERSKKNTKSYSTKKYSFLNKNKIKDIKTIGHRRTQSQKYKNLHLDYSLLNPLNPIIKNKRSKITTVNNNNNLPQYKNIRDRSFIGYSKNTRTRTRTRNNNSSDTLINNKNINNGTKRNIINITNITNLDEKKLKDDTFTRYKNNKSTRDTTPLNKNNDLSILFKNNPLDNSIIINNNSFLINKVNKSNQEIKKIKKISKNKSIKNKNRMDRINSLHNILTQYNNNNHSAFQPKNIFSQFKKKKTSNNNYKFGINNILSYNNKNNYIYGVLLEESKTPNNNKGKKNQNNNINKSQNSIKTSDTSVLPSNLVSHGTSSNSNILPNQIITNSNHNIHNHFNQKLNIYCHEIDFNLKGITKKEKEHKVNISTNDKNGNSNKDKKWKGKKIKCMHDLCKTGLAGDEKKVNQDNFFIFKNFVQGFDNIYMGVCDGHGYYGHEVSGFIKENLPMNLNHALKNKNLNLLKDDLSPVIKQCFINENKHLLDNLQIDSDLSGTTCISVIYTPQKLIIANLGDSRCILGKYINNKWVAENLSRDHKPTIKEEADRILKIGGRIRPMKDEDGEFIGPLRVYMKEKDMPGLAMTRSFGDYFGSLAGTISEPEVTEHVLSQEDKFIILASDGLFEFIESETIVEYVKDYYEKNDIVGCCEFLYKKSCTKWLDEEEDTIDDITIILVFFEDYFE